MAFRMRSVILMATLTQGIVWSTAQAQEVEPTQASIQEEIQAKLKKINDGLDIQSMQPSQFDALYEVVLSNGQILYVDTQSDFFMLGNLFQFDEEAGAVNLTEKTENKNRAALLTQVDESTMVNYAATTEEKAHITVFTDVDCTFCRELHKQMSVMNEMGITVSYLAFPRGGPNTATYNTMVSVWCGSSPEERNERMDVVKLGGSIEAQTCENPVLDQFILGQQMGVNATPTLVLDDGTLIPGFMPPDALAARLNISN